jgi:hypothetical protein
VAELDRNCPACRIHRDWNRTKCPCRVAVVPRPNACDCPRVDPGSQIMTTLPAAGRLDCGRCSWWWVCWPAGSALRLGSPRRHCDLLTRGYGRWNSPAVSSHPAGPEGPQDISPGLSGPPRNPGLRKRSQHSALKEPWSFPISRANCAATAPLLLQGKMILCVS